MMKLVGLIALLPLSAMAGERASIVVCPPNLSYCYHDDKPVLKEQKFDDAIREIEQRIDGYERENRAQLDRSLGGLSRALDRAHYLNGR